MVEKLMRGCPGFERQPRRRIHVDVEEAIAKAAAIDRIKLT